MRALALCALVGCASEPWPVLEPCRGDEHGGTCEERRVKVDGDERTFLVVRESPTDCAGGGLPVVFAWHGSDSSAQELHEYLEVERWTDGAMMLVYPQGLRRPELDERTGWDLDPKGVDTAFFDAMLKSLESDVCADTSRLFSVGHSRGGRFVDVLGCVRAERHLAMASIAAGAGNVETECGGGVPVWLTHGVDDEWVWFSEGERLRESWGARNGCAPSDWLEQYPVNQCTPLEGCEHETEFCPSDVEEWHGHYPPEFAGERIAAFFARYR